MVFPVFDKVFLKNIEILWGDNNFFVFNGIEVVMIKLHRFHMKIDKELLKEIDKRAMMMCTSRSKYINHVLSAMKELTSEFDLNPGIGVKTGDSCDFEYDIYVELRLELYNKLRYFQFRFGTFSIATVLRRILRFYLMRYKRSVGKIIKMVREFNRFIVGTYFDNGSHMCYGKQRTVRKIYICQNYTLKVIAGFP
ncbi:MAG TPA: hypothetical protein DDY71_04840 [Spirochaetia bacterium]|nr:MAG: hypothetical protein A2Y29_14070 [Spirochaetes bacterium GWE2_31_10]HBI36949.1 hypothetical protein [Spirochaetia bacterium]